MSGLSTDNCDRSAFRAIASDVVVPTNLKGTRAAIFFLLRSMQKQGAAKKPRVPIPVLKPSAAIRPAHRTVSYKDEETILIKKYLGADQFQFHSALGDV